MYYYDGDGNRVKKVENGQTTIYVGGLYEKNVSTGVTTTYYFAGSSRIAVRQGGTLTFLLGDHLGSTSVTLDASGNKIGEMKYTPFGETRLTTGSVPTDRRFTGQRQEDSGLGSLYDYGARFYSPALGRFLSADTLVPEPGNPQAFNRYAYSLNNPIKYIDPSGHSSKAIEDAAGLLGSGGGGPPTRPGDLERMAVTLIVGAAAFVGATYVAVTYGPVLVAGAETLAARVTTKLAEGVGACAIANCSDKAKQAVERVSKACGGDCSDELQAGANLVQRSSGPDVALGLTKYLPDFVRNTNWSTWEQLQDTFKMARSEGFFDWGPRMLNSARQLHFSLRGLGDWAQAFAQGKDGAGLTNWELYRILTDKALYAKTIFYDELGNVIQLPFQGD